MDNEQKIWNFLKEKGFTDYAVAGIMGNLYAESALKPTNLQGTGNKKLNLTDEEYTQKVDNGEYNNFITDSQGYGLAQWTYWSRKSSLLKYSKACKKSIGDLNMQLEFLVKEISSYSKVTKVLNESTSVKECSDAVLLYYERPINTSDSVKEKRASYAHKYYEKFAMKEYAKESKSNLRLAFEVLNNMWGNGSERKRRLTEAGYNYSEVQKIVNEIVQIKEDLYG